MNPVLAFLAFNPKVVVDFRVQKPDIVVNVEIADVQPSRHVVNEHVEMTYNLGKFDYTKTFRMFTEFNVDTLFDSELMHTHNPHVPRWQEGSFKEGIMHTNQMANSKSKIFKTHAIAHSKRLIAQKKACFA